MAEWQKAPPDLVRQLEGGSDAWRAADPTTAKFLDQISVPQSLMPSGDQLARWLTLGLSDKAGALGAATGAALPWSANPGGFWDTYRKRLEQSQAAGGAYAAQNPVADVAGSVAGGMLGAPIAAGAKAASSLGGAALQGLKGGAAVGALAGAGGAETGQELRGAGIGGAAGGVFGAALPAITAPLGRLAEGVKQHLPGIFPGATESAAMGRIAQRIPDSGPGSVAEMQTALSNTPTKPLGVVDVGSEELRGLAGNVARMPGPGRDTAKNFFTDRDVGATQRLLGDIDQHISAGGSAGQAIDDILAQQQAAAAPLYAKAHSTPIKSIPPKLQAYLDDPLIKKGVDQGAEILRLQGLRGAQPPPQNAEWALLDSGKNALDDIIEGYRDPVTRRLSLDRRGREIVEIRKDYLAELDKLNPDYAIARASWAGHSQARDAIELGGDFLRMDPHEIGKQVAAMSPANKDLFLLGAADKLRENVRSAALNGDESKRLINNEQVQLKLRPLFDSDDSFKAFKDAVMAERTMFETKTATLGGSQTAGRLAEDQGAPIGPVGKMVAGGAMAAAGGWPGAAFGGPMLAQGIRDAYSKLAAPSPQVRGRVAEKLFNPDLVANEELLRQLARLSGGQYSPQLLLNPGAHGLGSLVPPLVGGGQR